MSPAEYIRLWGGRLRECGLLLTLRNPTVHFRLLGRKMTSLSALHEKLISSFSKNRREGDIYLSRVTAFKFPVYLLGDFLSFANATKRREEEENWAGQSAATPPGFSQQINICGLWTFCTQLLKTNHKTCLFACIPRCLLFFWWWRHLLKLLKRRKPGWTQQWRFPKDLGSQRAVRRIRAPSLHRCCHSAGSSWKSTKNVTSHPVLTNSEKQIHLRRNRKTCSWNSIIIITVEEIAWYS